MPEIIHCSACGQSLRVEGLADRMSKLRHHYKEKHPKLWKKQLESRKRAKWRKHK